MEAVNGYLATAVFGPDRLDYWREALSADEKPEDTAPTQARVAELEREIAEAEGRIQR